MVGRDERFGSGGVPFLTLLEDIGPSSEVDVAGVVVEDSSVDEDFLRETPLMLPVPLVPLVPLVPFVPLVSL